ncbi:hypothetical protein JNB11_04580 [Kocuria palustris]|nr:hypothetical protein [Kocuria palustris]
MEVYVPWAFATITPSNSWRVALAADAGAATHTSGNGWSPVDVPDRIV